MRGLRLCHPRNLERCGRDQGRGESGERGFVCEGDGSIRVFNVMREDASREENTCPHP